MNKSCSTDPNTGFCPGTKIFHSLRPRTPFPPEHKPLSLADYVFSLLRAAPASPLEATDALIDASSGYRLSYSQFLRQVQSLAASLRRLTGLSKGDTAYILCPASLKIPVIYFSLLSLGVTISPANPIGSASEVSHQIQLSRPAIAFASSESAHKLPRLRLGTVLVDSQQFDSMLTDNGAGYGEGVEVNQSDPAAILYSSGTTGRLKGVLLTHRNLITMMAGVYHNQPANEEDAPHPLSLLTLPLFHVFGFFMLFRAVLLAETLVLMERFNLENMLKAVEKYRITYMPVSPPLVLTLTKSDLALKHDLSSLQLLSSGGAPLGKEFAERFTARFPNIQMMEGYGMTEVAGGATDMGPSNEAKLGSVGRLMADMEAKIVDPNTGEAQPPGQQGELWLRGPSIMKGYVGDDEATAATLDGEGWLKTGDLCYFDSEGFLFIVDRLKELIKYKAYQVPPAELEPLLQSNPEIADAAVIPYPDEEAGEIPMAFVVRKQGSRITAPQIMEFIAKQVAPYKKIRRVAFISSIPKSAAGKILRRELVNQALSKPRL